MLSDSRGKKTGLLITAVIIGSVVGGFAGDFLSSYKYLEVLSKGTIIGFPNPVNLDLGIIKLMFDIKLTLNLGGIIGMVLSILFIKKVYNF